MILALSNVHIVQAADLKHIRVGLKSLYNEVASITIKNEQLSIGYSVNSDYKQDEVLKSSSGFMFTPFSSYCFALDKTFTSYQSANSVAKTLGNLGVTAYPVSVYRKTWKVYVIGGSSNAEAKKAYEKVKGKFGFTYGSIQSDNKHRILVKGNSHTFLIDGKVKNAYPQFEAAGATNTETSTVDLGQRKYRGRIEIGCYGKSKVTAVNVVNIEHYLYGVVPSEMSASWPVEALKVQAVCARGYAMKTTSFSSMSNITSPYTLGDTASNQVYRGYNQESANSNKAVNETSGETLQYNGEIISTYYFSTSGGSTEAVEDVWTQALPYLRSVSDIYETTPAKKPWLTTYSASELKSLLSKKDYSVDVVKDVIPEIKTASGRVYSLRIQGEKSYASLQKDSIRSILSLPSSKFKIVKYGDIPDKVSVKSKQGTTTRQIQTSYIKSESGQVAKTGADLDQYIVKSAENISNYPKSAPSSKNTYVFAGMGYGHGIGMSQSGAKGMALAGFTYKEILTHYYTGTKIVE